ncbi:hypothetical protein IF1G_11352 [Cordyceps javanica]|uniref:Uncharacterized protein n=1 Tax=Cordyceps javanica TaxID=43265 RepID=A0A545UKI4_9HYPO|nr:hypothetical protein IF1G_11352 [Cordyceps javanica]
MDRKTTASRSYFRNTSDGSNSLSFLESLGISSRPILELPARQGCTQSWLQKLAELARKLAEDIFIYQFQQQALRGQLAVMDEM